MQRIPTLDGWRGLAITLVLLDHIQWALLHHYVQPWTQIGLHGVTIFFVISGFLITSRLVAQPIHLKQFYLRRFFRLIPAAWTYLAFIFIFNALVHGPFTSLAEICSCIFFYRNFLDRSGVAVHFWSLSVEEQFYLAWPIVLVFSGPRRALWLAAVAATGCAIYRFLFWSHYNRDLFNYQTQVRADALLVGCIFALLLKDQKMRTLARRWSLIWSLPCLATFLLCVANFHWLAPLSESVAIAGLLSFTVFHFDKRWIHFLSFPPLVWLGKVSYSAYLWQEFFTYLPWPHDLQPLLFCIGLPLITIASYYCIERPSTRFGHRLTPISSNA